MNKIKALQFFDNNIKKIKSKIKTNIAGMIVYGLFIIIGLLVVEKILFLGFYSLVLAIAFSLVFFYGRKNYLRELIVAEIIFVSFLFISFYAILYISLIWFDNFKLSILLLSILAGVTTLFVAIIILALATKYNKIKFLSGIGILITVIAFMSIIILEMINHTISNGRIALYGICILGILCIGSYLAKIFMKCFFCNKYQIRFEDLYGVEKI